MKKIILICIACFLFSSFYGCKKPPLPVIEENTSATDSSGNNNGGGTQVNPWVGTWNYTKIDLTNGTLKYMGQDAGSFTGTGSKISGDVILTENPKEYTTDLVFTADIDATFAGQNQAQSVPVDRIQTKGTWSESNGTITLTDDKGKDIQIISSTTSKIVFTGNFTNQVEVNQFITLDANSDVIFTITK
mgnify:FL=1